MKVTHQLVRLEQLVISQQHQMAGVQDATIQIYLQKNVDTFQMAFGCVINMVS